MRIAAFLGSAILMAAALTYGLIVMTR